jgi:hypothetical protein
MSCRGPTRKRFSAALSGVAAELDEQLRLFALTAIRTQPLPALLRARMIQHSGGGGADLGTGAAEDAALRVGRHRLRHGDHAHRTSPRAISALTA